MNQQSLSRLREYFKKHETIAALLSSAANVTWLTGYAPPIQTGPSPFEGGPGLLWWYKGELTLLLVDSEAAAGRSVGANVVEYSGYTVTEPLECFERQAFALRDLLKECSSITSTVGIEFRFLPASLVQVLRAALPNASLAAIDGDLDPLRAVKSPREIVKICAALELCDIGQAFIQERSKSGVSELELWGGVKAHMEIAAGVRLPVLADLVAGLRTAEVGGLPQSYVLNAGDPLLFDVVPRLDGYWGDNTGTYFVGEPSIEMKNSYKTVRETLKRGLDAARPGMRACDLDAMMRKSISSAGYEPYPHHTGHGIGTMYHEEPRITPYNQRILECGMIIALEPGIYLAGSGGVRLEHVLQITHDGCQVLTHHLID